MSPALLEERVERFQDMIASTERVGVSDFSRSKAWRDRLPQMGCFEVVDRADTVGYMLSPAYAKAIGERLADLEEQLERAQIAAMFKAREGYTNVLSGADLEAAVSRAFDDRIDGLLEVVHGG